MERQTEGLRVLIFMLGTKDQTHCYTRNAHTHLRAVALAAEVGARGSDGLCGGAAVDLSVGRAVGYGWTIVVCTQKPTDCCFTYYYRSSS